MADEFEKWTYSGDKTTGLDPKVLGEKGKQDRVLLLSAEIVFVLGFSVGFIAMWIISAIAEGAYGWALLMSLPAAWAAFLAFDMVSREVGK